MLRVYIETLIKLWKWKAQIYFSFFICRCTCFPLRYCDSLEGLLEVLDYNLGVLLGGRFIKIQQCVPAAQNASSTLVCSSREAAAGQGRWWSPLLCTPEAVCSTVSRPAGPVGEGPEEGHKGAQRAGAPLLWGQAAGAGLVHDEERAPGRPHHSFPVLKKIINRREKVTFYTIW